MKYKLRPYQEEAKNAALRHIAHRDRPGIIVAATGVGKSLIIAAMCRDLNDNIIVLQPNRELVLQNYEKFTSYAPDIDAGG